MQKLSRTLLGTLGLISLAAALGGACSASGDSSSSGDPGGGGPGSGPGGTGGAGTGTGSGMGGDPNFGGNGPGSGGSGGACASVSSEATSQVQPADIILAVDTSGSMDEESAEVQQNLNAFASIITASGIDVHVILIAGSEVCIPAPLGANNCAAGHGPDENLPGYRHVDQSVGSNNSLDLILSTYPQWQSSLRPNATKTLAVVSDDNSDLSANAFMSQLVALDPTFQGFKFDAIVSFQAPSVCTSCFIPPSACASCASACCNKNLLCQPISADEGTVYKNLVQQTGGVIGDLCLQDFDPVFNNMATAVVTGSSVSCEYDIPPIPDGGMFNPNKVNVAYSANGGMPQIIGYVAGGGGACTPQAGGWYYDNPQNPTKILLCPSTCNAVQGSATGKVEVQFGCDTIVVPE